LLQHRRKTSVRTTRIIGVSHRTCSGYPADWESCTRPNRVWPLERSRWRGGREPEVRPGKSGQERLERTADFAASRSGNRRIDFGVLSFRLFRSLCFMTRGLQSPQAFNRRVPDGLGPFGASLAPSCGDAVVADVRYGDLSLMWIPRLGRSGSVGRKLLRTGLNREPLAALPPVGRYAARRHERGWCALMNYLRGRAWS
jgi:hypothetical protein